MGQIKLKAGGGFYAMNYTLQKAIEAGGVFRFFTKMASRNACKTCALGMGGQKGGMINEAGRFPEFCKKSVQAQTADMTGIISESFFDKTSIQAFSAMSSRELEKLGRLAFPIIANENDSHYRRISWDEALHRSAEAFNQTTPERVFIYASGRSSNEAAFLLQLVGRAYGTSNINNCSYYCHQASGVALNKVYGSGTASVVLDDLQHSDIAIIAGANPASNHPRLITELMHLRRRGGKVIVINPVKELGLTRFSIPSDPMSLLFGSEISNCYLQPKVGSDIAVFKAILKGLIENKQINSQFIKEATPEGQWESVKEDIESESWKTLLEACGLTRSDIDEAVQLIGESEKGILMWAMGLTQQVFGVDNILAFSNIALSQGWLGQIGAGLLPLRGHSNVQGVGSVGVAPKLKEAFAKKMEALFDIQNPKAKGLDTFESIEAAINGQIDTALLLGGNLYSSNPDTQWAEQALRNISTTIGLTTKLNQGHFLGRGKTSILLPVLARDEESQATSQESMFNYIRLSDGGEALVAGEMKSEVEIIATLSEKILPEKTLENGFDWSKLHSHQELRKAISQIVPNYKNLSSLDKNKTEFQLQGRTFHSLEFPTTDKKAHFHVTALPPINFAPTSFRLMTLRSEGQFNSVVYEEEDIYRGNSHRNVVMLSVQDADKLSLKEGDPVTVKTETGSMQVFASITDISSGSLAMYYPEANCLVPGITAPDSKTPTFKLIEAQLISGHLK